MRALDFTLLISVQSLSAILVDPPCFASGPVQAEHSPAPGFQFFQADLRHRLDYIERARRSLTRNEADHAILLSTARLKKMKQN